MGKVFRALLLNLGDVDYVSGITNCIDPSPRLERELEQAVDELLLNGEWPQCLPEDVRAVLAVRCRYAVDVMNDAHLHWKKRSTRAERVAAWMRHLLIECWHHEDGDRLLQNLNQLFPVISPSDTE